jgi:flagellar biogenesis protein FliO
MKAWILLLVLILIAVDGHSAINIKSVELKKVNDEKSVAVIQYEGTLTANPELNVAPRMIQVIFPESTAWPKIEKQADLIGRLDTTLMAYQYDKDTVRFRILLPYASEAFQEATSVNLKDQVVEVEFRHPKNSLGNVVANVVKTKNNPGPAAKTVSAIQSFAVTNSKVEGNDKNDTPKNEKVEYDEKYLSELLNDKAENKNEKTEYLTDFPEKKSGLKYLSQMGEKREQEKSLDGLKKSNDQVTVQQAGEDKKSNEFSLSKYIAKFVAFLALMLLGFFALVHVFKKGVLRKGKFGFLKNSDLVSVISTTYLAPKRSLMVVKAYNQVLLLGSSENGIHFLGEIDDLSGVLKQSEQELGGTNFDARLDHEVSKTSTNKSNSELDNSHIKIKDNISISHNNALDKFLSNTKKSTKAAYKQNIQEKIKGLKSLQ